MIALAHPTAFWLLIGTLALFMFGGGGIGVGYATESWKTGLLFFFAVLFVFATCAALAMGLTWAQCGSVSC